MAIFSKPLQNTLFNRDTYDGIGSRVWISGGYDEDFNYIVPVGSTWTWYLYRIEDEKGNAVNQLLSEYPITYQGEVGSCKTSWSNGWCTESTNWAVWWTYPCASEGRYRIKVLFNGNLVGEDEFSPSRYKPFIYARGSKETIRPKVTKNDTNAETTDVQILIRGVAGKEQQCTAPIYDATVRFTNTIVEEVESADGHAHFTSNNEIGTGEYIKSFATDVLNPDSDFDATKNTSIEGKTNSNGFYQTKYKAGDFGIRETVTIEVTRDATDIHPELTLESKEKPVQGEESDTYTLDIKIPDLIPMKEGINDGEFLFVYGGSCLHNPTARWVIPSMKSRLVLLDAIYKNKFGHRLSFNDASLPFGGVIDNNTGTELNPKPGGRDSECHVSHRQGIDIDLNRKDEGKINILTETYLLNGRDIKRIGYVTKMAELLKLNKIKERDGQIHYRLEGY